MRYTLKGYQTDAVRDVLRNLERARDSYHRFNARSQFSLAAVTGAGKTVMAAAVIESLFFGNDEFDFEPDPGAVVLWFSDDPSLNEQSRIRIQAAASELDSRLNPVPTTFSEPKFRPQTVYFLNTQKLSKNSRLVKGQVSDDEAGTYLPGLAPRPDEVQSSIYDTITNTIQDDQLTLYLILDEAHRGMNTRTNERTTIVQRLINGHGMVPSMPVVFGISATVERFDLAMKDAKGRDALASVAVESALVQDSGLLKDDIALYIPAEDGVFETVLLTEAVNKVRASSAAWADYALQQGDAEAVQPLLVVQVQDKPSDETLVRTIDTIHAGWPELDRDAVAHVFGEHNDLIVGQQTIPYIEPQRVQEADHVRVLLAKTAISTGWDCPRAEVLVSFRPAVDRTHITQLLGRMMRTPLARRIPGDQILNSVDCLLPLFDRKTAISVADLLVKGETIKDGDDDDSGGGPGRRVLFDPVALYPNPAIDPAVWEAFAAVQSETLPKKHAKPIRRLTSLATELSKDGLIENAVEQAHRALHAVMDGRAVQYQEKVDRAHDDVMNMQGEEVRGRVGVGLSYEAFSVSADPRAIEDYYRTAARVLSPAICSSYVEHLAGPDGKEDDLLDARIVVASLGRVSEIAEAVEQEADNLARKWLSDTRRARKSLSDARQDEYDELESQSTTPEPIFLTVPKTAQADTKERKPDGTEHELPSKELHLMADENGLVPIDLNGWERQVLDSEMSQTGFRGWYRNPGRTSRESLAVSYKDDSGNWKALRPDFLFFTTRHDGTVAVDLVDPHGHHLADAISKLRGLADFAEKFSDGFRRIESVAETSGKLRVLDIKRPGVRQAIRSAQSAKALYESELASDY